MGLRALDSEVATLQSGNATEEIIRASTRGLPPGEMEGSSGVGMKAVVRGDRTPIWQQATIALAMAFLWASDGLAQAEGSGPDPMTLVDFYALADGIVGIHRVRGSLDGVDNAEVDRAGRIPSTLDTSPQDRSDGTMTHRHGGRVQVAGRGDVFAVQFDGVPSATCMDLVKTTGTGLGRDGGLSLIAVNGQGADDPALLEALSQVCTGPSNRLMWRFSLAD